MTPSQLRRLNSRLETELGRNSLGGPNLKWAYSEDLRHPVRVPGKYSFAKTTDSGLSVAEPVYEVRKMNPFYVKQWVVCRWEAPIPEEDWRSQFGDLMEWPRGGEYYPTNMALPAGVEPTEWWTDHVIALEKKRRSKTLADHEADIQSAEDRKERSDDSRRDAILRDLFTAFGRLPGSNSGGVSLPNPAHQARNFQ